MTAEEEDARGAYGFRIIGLEQGARHLHPSPPGVPALTVRRRRGRDDTRAAGTVRVLPDRAELWLTGGGRIDVQREPVTVTFTSPEPLSADAILHPFLGLPAAIAAWWLGRIALHGGAFLLDGRAWAVLGDRGAGKSTTLGHLDALAVPVLSDDILVIEGTAAFAGPRSIDLRADAAEQIGGEPLGHLGSRARWRLRPAVGPASAPLAGLVLLEWGDAVRLEALEPDQRLRALIASCALRPGPELALALLELAALPAWRFARPRGLAGAPAAVGQLLAELTASQA